MDNDCINGHNQDYICKLLLNVSRNIMLKNLCGKKSDMLNIQKSEKRTQCKKGKLQTLK